MSTDQQAEARVQGHAAIDAAMDKVRDQLASQLQPDELSSEAFAIVLKRILADVESWRDISHRQLASVFRGTEALFERDAGGIRQQ